MARRKLAVVLGGGALPGAGPYRGAAGAGGGLDFGWPDLGGGHQHRRLGGQHAHRELAGEVPAHVRRYLDSPSYDQDQLTGSCASSRGGRRPRLAQLRQFIFKGMAIGKTLVSRSLVSEDEYARAIAELLPDVRIEELRILFYGSRMAGDLHTGERCSSPADRSAAGRVMASCAVPACTARWRTASGCRRRLGGQDAGERRVGAGGGPGAGGRVSWSRRPRWIGSTAWTSSCGPTASPPTGWRTCRTASADLCLKPDLEDVHWLAFQLLDEVVAPARSARHCRTSNGWWRRPAGSGRWWDDRRPGGARR